MELKKRPTWTTADGRVLIIAEMDTDHLINAINFCRKKHSVAALEIPYPSFQGEMAQYYAEAEWESLVSSSAEEAISGLQDLINELEWRKRQGIQVGEENW